MVDWPGFVGPVVAALIGVGGLAIVQVMKGRQDADQRQADAQHAETVRRAGVEQADAERRSALQRETLTELRGELAVLVESALAVYRPKMSAYHSATPDQQRAGELQMSEEWRDERLRHHGAFSRIQAIGPQVDDAEVRDIANEMLVLSDRLTRWPPGWFDMEKASDPDASVVLQELRTQVNGRIGELLRGPIT